MGEHDCPMEVPSSPHPVWQTLMHTFVPTLPCNTLSASQSLDSLLLLCKSSPEVSKTHIFLPLASPLLANSAGLGQALPTMPNLVFISSVLLAPFQWKLSVWYSHPFLPSLATLLNSSSLLLQTSLCFGLVSLSTWAYLSKLACSGLPCFRPPSLCG